MYDGFFCICDGDIALPTDRILAEHFYVLGNRNFPERKKECRKVKVSSLYGIRYKSNLNSFLRIYFVSMLFNTLFLLKSLCNLSGFSREAPVYSNGTDICPYTVHSGGTLRSSSFLPAFPV